MRAKRVKFVAPAEFFEPSYPPKSYKLRKDYTKVKGEIEEKPFLGLFAFKESFLEETKIQPRYLVIGEDDEEKASRVKAEKERKWSSNWNNPPAAFRWDRIVNHQNPHFYITRHYRYWNNPNTVRGDEERRELVKFLEVKRILRECEEYKRLVLSSWLEKNNLYTPPINKNKLKEEEIKSEKKPSPEPSKKNKNKYSKVNPSKPDASDFKTVTDVREAIEDSKKDLLGTDQVDWDEYWAIEGQLESELEKYTQAQIDFNTRHLQSYDPRNPSGTNPNPAYPPNQTYPEDWYAKNSKTDINHQDWWDLAGDKAKELEEKELKRGIVFVNKRTGKRTKFTAKECWPESAFPPEEDKDRVHKHKPTCTEDF